jgi:L-iditol 2-dehydrogenase
MMQALVLTAFGELQLVEHALPALEHDDDVLLEILSAGVCGSDLHGYTGSTGRRKPPVIMGHEATARVLATEPAARHLAIGTRVALHPIDTQHGPKRHIGIDAPGTYATHTVWPASNLFVLPENVSNEAGALAEPVAVALHATNLVELDPSDTAFVAGAGPIGLLVAAVLVQRGVRVIISDLSETRLELARALGVQATVNPAAQSLSEAIAEATGGKRADVAFEAVGIGATVEQCLTAVKDRGTIVWVGNNQRHITLDMQAVVTRELAIQGSYAMTLDDFGRAIELLASGMPVERLIGRRARLEEGPRLFDELLASPEIIKCMFVFD